MQTLRKCEENDLTIICPADQSILLHSALYGKLKNDYCPDKYPPINTNCNSPNSFRIVADKCSGEERCTIFVSNKVFGGDPCRGTNKYLEVQYSCKENPPPSTKETIITTETSYFTDNENTLSTTDGNSSESAFDSTYANNNKNADIYHIVGICIGVLLVLVLLLILGIILFRRYRNRTKTPRRNGSLVKINARAATNSSVKFEDNVYYEGISDNKGEEIEMPEYQNGAVEGSHLAHVDNESEYCKEGPVNDIIDADTKKQLVDNTYYESKDVAENVDDRDKNDHYVYTYGHFKLEGRQRDANGV